MGLRLDEVVADYVVTYYNYYGVEPVRTSTTPLPTATSSRPSRNAFGVEDLSKRRPAEGR